MRPAVITFIIALDVVIAALALMPSAGFPEPASTFLHVFVSAMNVVLLARIFGAVFPAAYLVLIAGMSVELLQIFVPGRSATLEDIAADACGVLIGVLVNAAVAPTFSRPSLDFRQQG